MYSTVYLASCFTLVVCVSVCNQYDYWYCQRGTCSILRIEYHLSHVLKCSGRVRCTSAVRHLAYHELDGTAGSVAEVGERVRVVGEGQDGYASQVIVDTKALNETDQHAFDVLERRVRDTSGGIDDERKVNGRITI